MEVQTLHIILNTDSDGRILTYTNIEPNTHIDIKLNQIPHESIMSASSCMKCSQTIEVKLYTLSSSTECTVETTFFKTEDSIEANFHDEDELLKSHEPDDGDDSRISEDDDQELVEEYNLFMQVAATHTQHICFVCGKKYGSRPGLAKHYENSSCQRPIVTKPSTRYSCTVCRRRFILKRELKAHTLETHPNGRNSFRCKECDTEFTKQQDLTKHDCTVSPINKKTKDIRFAGRMNMLKPKEYEYRFDEKPDTNNVKIESTIEEPTEDSQNFSESQQDSTQENDDSDEDFEWPENEAEPSQSFAGPETYTTRHEYELYTRIKRAKRLNTCFECKTQFKTVDSLNYHYLSTDCKKPKLIKLNLKYKCPVCSRSFVSKKTLDEHKIDVHPKGKLRFYCRKCSREFEVKYLYDRHVCEKIKEENVGSKVKLPKKFVCEDCNRAYRLEESYNYHRMALCRSLNAKLKGQFYCNHCKRNKFMSQEELMKHKENVHGYRKIRIHDCKYCGIRFENNREKHRHIEKIHSKTLLCHLCSMKFSKKRELEDHILNHETPLPFQCDICGMRKKTRSLLSVHFRLKHIQNPDQMYKCSICSHGLKTEEALKAHVQLHDRSFACPECNKVFTQKGNLKTHMQKMHVDARDRVKFTCEVCTKVCFSKDGLEVHKLSHLADSEKPFPCSYCAKGFTTISQKQVHERIHTGERPYTCSQCGKNFRHSDSLKTHIRTHTGEKPYECKICLKKFSDRGHRGQHYKQHEKQLGIKITGSVLEQYAAMAMIEEVQAQENKS